MNESGAINCFFKRNLRQLTVKIKPMMVQNRCYANRGWDRDIRDFCKTNAIQYQGFSLLTANVPVLQDFRVNEIAYRLKLNPMQVVFLFAHQIGMLPLTGTKNEEHMKEDLLALDSKLTKDELVVLDSLS